MTRLALLAVLALAACGADGPPITPSANLGVSLTPSGVSVNPSVGARSGPLSVSLDL